MRILSLSLVIISFFSCQRERTPITFAVIADVHQDIIHDAPERLETFFRAAQDNKVDFIIELGDFCFKKDENIPFRDLWNSYELDNYHALGNHDMDICTKDEYMAFIGMKERYYSFDKGDYHFIVLDPNNLFIDGKYTPYANGNYYVDASQRAHVDPEQIEWLKKDLAATEKQCIIFSHQSLEKSVSNGELVRKVLEEENTRAGEKKVLAAFSGHDHTSYMKTINDIAYIQINSASYQWVGDKYICTDRYNDSINALRPALKYTVTYQDALYSIVTISDDKIEVKGIKTEFVSPTPQDLGIPNDLHSFPLTPQNSDFVIDTKRYD